MRTKVILAAVALAVAFISGCSSAGESEQPDSVSDFEFVVTLDEAGAILEGHHGTGWSRLEWSGMNTDSGKLGDGETGFWINRQGVAGDELGLVGDGFVISILSTSSSAVLTSHAGAYWSELTYDCGGKTPCSFVVNQNGVSEAE